MRRGFDSRGYHPGDYSHPRTPRDRFEIVMGAILTQNTAWTNVETALQRLRDAGISLPADLRAHSAKRLAPLIRSSGYFNQKALKLSGIAVLFRSDRSLRPSGAPSREALLSEWGIGPETADSILLYGFQKPLFVVDAYTRRILSRIGVIEGGESYAVVQELFHASLASGFELYNEYHALIVEHAKQHCRSKPACAGCPVRTCRYQSANGT